MHFKGLILCLAALLSTAQAQLPEIKLPQASIQILHQDRLDTGPAWREFQDRHPGWRVVDWDRIHDYPHRALGDGICLPGGPIASAEDLDDRLRDFLASHPGLLSGSRRDAPEDIDALYIGRHGKLWYARYAQRWAGRLVLLSELVFRVTLDGHLLMMGSDLHPGLDAREPELDRSAVERLLAGLPAGEHKVAEVRVEEDWVLLPLLDGKNFRFEAAWPGRVLLDHPEHDYRVFVSGRTGEILWSWNQVRHVVLEGTLMGIVEEQQPSDPDLPQPLAYVQLDVEGQQVTTGRDGSWSLELEMEGPWSLQAQCYGDYADVNRTDGADGQYWVDLYGDEDTLTFDLDYAQIQELDAYLHTTRVHDFITDLDDSFTGLDESLPVNININSVCNAYWDGSSINFFREGGGCHNTARLAGVVYHEYGHGVNDRQYMQAGEPFGMTNGALHEGLADVTAVYLMDVHYVSPGWNIRDLDNNNSYPEHVTGEVHADGMIIGGAMWHMREALGLELVRPMHHYARWGTPDDPDLGRCFFEYFIEIVLVDDDDGDLSNLTPHWEEINGAFNQHGIGSVLAWIAAEFEVVEAPFYTPPGEALELTASLSAPVFLFPESVELVYWIDDQPEETVEFVEIEAGLWQGEIPGQDYDTVVHYYARVINDAEVDILAPPGAPAEHYRTRFAYRQDLLFTFEEDGGGGEWEGVWDWGEPQSGPVEAHSGLNAWATDLYQNYPDDHLARLSFPSQTVRDEDMVLAYFYHWMDMETGWDGVNVEAAVNYENFEILEPWGGYDMVSPGNNIWPGVPALTGQTEGWERLVLDLSDRTEPGDLVRLRLNMFSDGWITAPGWYVDDLQYIGFEGPQVLIHEPLADSEDMQQVEFPVLALLNTEIEIDDFLLSWRVEGGEIVEQEMEATGEPQEYASVITGPFPDQTVEYRLEASNAVGFYVSFPEDDSWHAFHVGPDLEPPLASFTSPPYDVIGHSATYHVEAQASDNQAVAEVSLNWREAGGQWQELAQLQQVEGDLWSVDAYFYSGGLSEAEFALRVVDAAEAQNEGWSETVSVSLGEYQYVDDFPTIPMPHWNVSGEWIPQDVRVHEGEYALGTSADNFYDPWAEGEAEFGRPIDLEHAEAAFLVFWECWFLEPEDDFVFIEASTDGGQNWEMLEERTSGSGWVQTALSLQDYLGQSDLRFRFRLQADGDNDGLHIGYFVDEIEIFSDWVSVEPPAQALSPGSFRLSEARPNPFNPVTRVELELPRALPVRAELFDLRGASRGLLHSGILPAGRHTLLVESGRLSSGLYLLSVSGGSQVEVRKLLLIK